MNESADWQPTASPAMLRRRARLLADVRTFFDRRGVLEVETPYLSTAGATELHLHSLASRLAGQGPVFLHTSPEFPMKRLLAAGSGPIWQSCRVFRDGEAGPRHNPEFSLLEWYRPGFALDELMAEVHELAVATGATADPPDALTYQQAFLRHTGLDPFRAETAELAAVAESHGLAADDLDRDQWLDLLFGAVVCPDFPAGRPTFVTRFPAEQASLARLCPDDPRCAERFEYFIGSLELANGFHELADPAEQRRRFDRDNAARRSAGLPEMPADERLLAALEAGMPDCCGVALGLDRLLMVIAGAATIAGVMAFPMERA